MLDINTLQQLTDLQANTLYSAEIAHLSKVSREAEVNLIENARRGDNEARNALIVSCLSYALGKARYLYYERQPKHDDLLDLAQEASLQMMIGLDNALTKKNPASYLRGIAHRSISIYCTYHSGFIKKPAYTLVNQVDDPRLNSVESLDAPIYDEGKRILVEFIEAPEMPIEQVEDAQQKRNTALYKAISKLSRTQQEVIIRFYGLFGEPKETVEEICPSNPNLARSHARTARLRLLALLEEE